MKISHWIVLRMRNVSGKVKKKTRIIFKNIPPLQKIVRLGYNVEKNWYIQAGHTGQYNMSHALWITTATDINRKCSTSWFCVAKTVTRECVHVTFIRTLPVFLLSNRHQINRDDICGENSALFSIRTLYHMQLTFTPQKLMHVLSVSITTEFVELQTLDF